MKLLRWLSCWLASLHQEAVVSISTSCARLVPNACQCISLTGGLIAEDVILKVTWWTQLYCFSIWKWELWGILQKEQEFSLGTHQTFLKPLPCPWECKMLRMWQPHFCLKSFCSITIYVVFISALQPLCHLQNTPISISRAEIFLLCEWQQL